MNETKKITIWSLPIPESIDHFSEKEKKFLYEALIPSEQKRFDEATHPGFRAQYLASHALARVKISPDLEMEEGKRPRMKMDPRLRGDDTSLLNVGGDPCVTPLNGQTHGFAPTDGDEKHIRHSREGGDPSSIVSLSHTKKMVVCSLGDVSHGIDVEYLKEPRVDEGRLAMVGGPEEEVKDVESRKGEDRMFRFYQYAVLKESLTKASGIPVLYTFAHAVFSLKPNGDITVRSNPEIWEKSPKTPPYKSDEFQFQILRPSQDHLLGLALHHQGKYEVDLQVLSLMKLIM